MTTLHDRASAETYCATCGRVLSLRAAHVLAERYELGAWAKVSNTSSSTKGTPEDVSTLLKMLLEVYMTEGYGSIFISLAHGRAEISGCRDEEASAHLLSAQAINFNTVDVCASNRDLIQTVTDGSV